MRTVRHTLLSALILLAFLIVPPSQAQEADELGDALSTIGQQYADNYTQPVTDALGANLNAGLFRTAEVGGEGIIPVIDLYVGVAGMGALTAGSETAFQLSQDQIQTDDGRTLTITYPQGDLPTVFGEETSPGQAVITDQATGTSETVDLPPGLLDTPIAPLAIPQIGAGTVFGTDAQLRFLPETSISDYGSVSVFGLSVRHSISQYIPLSPVNLAVQGTWQSLSLSGAEDSNNPGEIVDASGWALNAQVSKSIPVAPITFYGGLQYEKFTTEYSFDFQAPTGQNIPVTLEQDASNTTRGIVGLSVNFTVIRLNVDYAVSNGNNVATVGAGFRL